ncbi:hypothetical protein GCM10023223_03840 [Stackebrandtia albiflava]
MRNREYSPAVADSVAKARRLDATSPFGPAGSSDLPGVQTAMRDALILFVQVAESDRRFIDEVLMCQREWRRLRRVLLRLSPRVPHSPAMPTLG